MTSMPISHPKLLPSLVVSLLPYLILISLLEDVISAGIVGQNQARRDDNGRAAGIASDGLEVAEPDEKVFNVMQNRDIATSMWNDDNATLGGEDLEFTIDDRMIGITFRNACEHSGKARVVIPKGQYKVNRLTFDGPCRSKRIIVQLFGDLIGPTDSSLLPNSFWIDVFQLNNVIFLGSGGTIDGKLPVGIDCGDDDECILSMTPCNVKFEYCSNMVVKGIRSINPRAHHLNVEHCNNMTFENLYLNTLVRNSDTDGINTRNSSFVKISNSVIATGGDCISLDDGSTDFSISNITCGPGRGMSIGSLGKYLDPESWLPVRDIHVKKILFRDTFSGIHIMTYPKPIENQVHDVYFEDIVMDNVRNPIVIDQEYNTENATTSSRVKISNIHIHNVRGTSNTPTAVNLKCSKTFPCEGLDFFNIDLKYNGTGPDQITSSCLNARPSYSGIQMPAPCTSVYT